MNIDSEGRLILSGSRLDPLCMREQYEREWARAKPVGWTMRDAWSYRMYRVALLYRTIRNTLLLFALRD